MKMSKTKQPLYVDTENQAKAMRAADNMVKTAEYIAEIYSKQLMLPPLTTENFRNLVSGGSGELERQVAQTWKDSMNKFQPGLGDASPLLPKPVEYNPPRFDRHCESLRGRGMRTEHEHVSLRDITIVDGKPVVTDEARQAIKDKSCVFETPENKKHLEAFTKLAEAATAVQRLLDEKRQAYAARTGLDPKKPTLIDQDGLPHERRGVIYFDKTERVYKVNNNKLSYGVPKPKAEKPKVKAAPKAAPKEIPKAEPNVTRPALGEGGTLQPTRYKSTLST